MSVCADSGKRPLTKKQARRLRDERQALDSSATLRIYPCRHCGGYHLTSQPWRPRRRAKAT